MLCLMYTASEVAEYALRITEKTFRNRRQELRTLGFPEPLNLPGDQRWSVAEIEEWIASRKRVDPAPRKAPRPVAAIAANLARSKSKPRQSDVPAVKRGRGRPRKIQQIQHEERPSC